MPTRGKGWLAAQFTRAARPVLIACEAGDSTTMLLLLPSTLPAAASSVVVSCLLRVTVVEAMPLLHVSVAGVIVTGWPSLPVRVTEPL